MITSTTSSHLSIIPSLSFHHHNHHSSSLNFPILTRRTTTSLFTSTPNYIRRRALPPLSASPSSGGNGGGISGGGGGGGGGGEEEGDAGDRNKSEAVLALVEAGRSLDSLPKDIAAAIEAGRLPGSIVYRYLELEKSALFRWLLQFGGFKERLLADDLFLTKVAIECGVGIFTKVYPPV